MGSLNQRSGGAALRVVIVEGEDLFRAGLRAMLETQGLRVVGEARRTEEAAAIVTRAAPDVVLADLEGPGPAVSAAARRLTELAPDATVVALTGALEPDEVVDVLIAGAGGCLAKAESVGARVAEIVRATAAGETLLSGRTTRALLERLRRMSAAQSVDEALLASLSPRELDVLRLIVQGRDNIEIGSALFISPQTVKHHVATMCQKLGAENRVQAAVAAVRAGLA